MFTQQSGKQGGVITVVVSSLEGPPPFPPRLFFYTVVCYFRVASRAAGHGSLTKVLEVDELSSLLALIASKGVISATLDIA